MKTTVGDAEGIANEMVVGGFGGADSSFLDSASVMGADGGMTTGVPGTLEV